MRTTPRPRRCTPLLLAVFTPVAGAQGLLIDSFDAPQFLSGPPSAGEDSLLDAAILGGERDLWFGDSPGCSGGEYGSIAIGNGTFHIDNIPCSLSQGFSTVTAWLEYDALDNSIGGTCAGANGMSADLTDGGLANAFALDVVSGLGAFTIRFVVRTGPVGGCSGSVDIQAPLTAGTTYIPFAAFGTADFTDVEGIRVQFFTLNSNAEHDLILSGFRTAQSPCNNGACCNPCGYSCTEEMNEADCTTAGGVWQGDCTDCVTTECAGPGGVCTVIEMDSVVPTGLPEGAGQAGDRFGEAIALSGDRMIVGAPNHDNGGAANNSGRAYVFSRTGTTWSFEDSIAAEFPAASDFAGRGVDIQGDNAIVGVPQELTSSNGFALVSSFNGSAWDSGAGATVLLAPDGAPGDQFGRAVAMDGGIYVVGAPEAEDGPVGEAGAAYVFEDVSGPSPITNAIKLVAQAPFDTSNNAFGASVAIDGDVIVVGAPDGDTWGNGGGRAYVFRRDDNGTPGNPADDTWPQEQMLDGMSSTFLAQFGTSVAIDGDTIVVGASGENTTAPAGGAVYVYRYGGGIWSEEARLTPCETGGALFGDSVGVQGDTIVVGMPQGGTCYVYQHQNGAWVEQARFDPTGGQFGSSCAISGGTVAVGAPEGDVAGAAHVFHGIDDCNLNGALDACDILSGASADADDDGFPDDCDGVEDIDTGESIALIPDDGGGDETQEITATFTNTSGPDDANVAAAAIDANQEPNAGGFAVFDTQVSITTNLDDGEFFLTVTVPFTDADLGAQSLADIDLSFYDPLTDHWRLAVAANTANSPGHTSPVGDRFQVEDTVIPTLSTDLGDHGVFWNTSTLKGFAWANVDHTTLYAPGVTNHDIHIGGPREFAIQTIGPGAFAYDATVWASDMDADDDLDILVNRQNETPHIVWYENESELTPGLPGFTTLNPVVASQGPESDTIARPAAVFDYWVSNGATDIVLRYDNGASSRVEYLENFGQDGVSFWRHYNLESNVDQIGGVCSCSIDSDGLPDMAFSVLGTARIFWRDSFDCPFDGPTSVQAGSISCGDIDGDNPLDGDLVIGAFGGIYWYENTNGSGLFNGPANAINESLDDWVSVDVVDVNGDGDLDVLAWLGGATPRIIWFGNGGAGAFNDSTLVADTIGVPSDVQTGDMDGDGDVDVVASSLSTDTVAWFENADGSGTFNSQQTISTTVLDPTKLTIGDLDGDGDRDLATVSPVDAEVSWFESSAPGSLILEPGEELDLAGDLRVTINDYERFDLAQATLRMNGETTQTLEALSRDIGAVESGFDRGIQQYPIGTLRVLGLGTVVNLVDEHDHDGQGFDVPEALYIDTLEIGADSTLNTNGITIYYRNAHILGTFDTPTNFVRVAPPPVCPGDVDGDDDTDVFDFNVFAPNFGSTHVFPFTGGDLDGDGDVDVFDFNIFAADFSCGF